MSKYIIEGKKYDTETSKLIGSADGGGQSSSDGNYWQEKLYKSPKGQYWIEAEGGAMSKYGTRIDHSTFAYGFSQYLISVSDAEVWACENMSNVKKVEENFNIEEG